MCAKRICAWCKKDLGEAAGSVSGITHGMCQSCLTRIRMESVLRTEHLAAGLTLEQDDHTLQLKKSGQVVARFSSLTGKPSILEEADKYI
jgi:hypothetical protein